ncbi:glycosyl hydrolase 115 family protein [Flavobacteriaceae bacterium XHP0103]|uniref:glycosyl hydrolase 115 family protein n=1 Tax=Marixanthotalea marina TaxID=2844359 RepID=UPI00298A07E5|nr:glycosyl hydrolase 115 family protein [Marixanthotalea marina]MBU3821944.1 glycosyl hydrolase 115 family protein [Marixanthotalea marina]
MQFKTKTKALFKTALLITALILSTNVQAIDPNKYVSNESSKGSFPVATNGAVTPILVSDSDYPGVLRVLGHLQKDIKNVTGIEPQIFKNSVSGTDNVIIVGTIGKSPIIDQLIKNGKIKSSLLVGKREKFIIQSINNPLPGVKRALVIAGSEKRGTIYGMYDLSNEIGVHPWHFWADVPAKKQSELHVMSGIHTKGEPKVKYRGLFINDEAPALTGWVEEHYGKFNAEFYDKVFELIMRMKGNYIWPAMWQPRMFYEDDPQNGVLADEYGIVMGTSHHEPLTRAHEEWGHLGGGEWNFETNPEELKEFWKGGMERMGDKETLVTIGMRGDGDSAMSEGTAIDLLEEIVKEQRKIIADVTGKPAEETPQIWALYKEVQDYYDKGMTVPDDVTLLLCDDNWGNIRKLPSLDAKPRKGGYGIYYHFDYVGGPRNYKWLNTNQIERTWEQMHLAYKHGVDQVWIVNVGDIKPMEFPLEFFLDYAWNPDAWNADNLDDYYSLWAEEVFDGIETEAIADIVKKYTKYNARRKHEMIDARTYSLSSYNEANNVVKEFNDLAEKAQAINDKLPELYKDAYYQLVLFPVLASANLNELYVSAAKNNLYAKQGRASTNYYADRVRELFNKDRQLTNYYHKEMADGKWNHMMSQTHIGYDNWQQPRFNQIPETFKIDEADDAEMGVSIEGSNKWWSGANEDAVLPVFDPLNDQKHSIEIFNRGKQSFNYTVKSNADWIKISEASGSVENKKNIYVSIDWTKAPKGIHKSSVTISGASKNIPVHISINNYDTNSIEGFVENDGYITINAEHFSDKYEPKSFEWKVVENLGKTSSAVISLPIEKGRVELSKKSPKLSYSVNIQNKGKVKVHMHFSPTINYSTREGMYFGLSFDKEAPIQVNYDADPNIFNYNGKVPRNWHNDVGNSIKIITTELEVDEPGNHTLNYYRIDEGLVLQRIIIETPESNLKETYLGPPQSFNAN